MVEIGIGGIVGSVRFSCFIEDLVKVFELFIEVICEFVFIEEKLDFVK